MTRMQETTRNCSTISEVGVDSNLPSRMTCKSRQSYRNPRQDPAPLGRGCESGLGALSNASRGWRGQAPRQPGQVRKEAAVTSPAWVVVQPLTQSNRALRGCGSDKAGFAETCGVGRLRRTEDTWPLSHPSGPRVVKRRFGPRRFSRAHRAAAIPPFRAIQQ